jgi:1-deoxy-D-xylulose-5-phosphate reductoisomerase
MNKGLEVIEAHYLFDMDYDKIKAVLHKESIVHGIVTFNDGSVKAVLAKPDMRMPILGALSYPKRLESGIEEIDFTNLNLSFYPLSFEKYPLLKAAYDAGKKGGLYPTVLNAANEAAVNLFIKEKISFLEIEEIVIKVLKEFKDNVSNPTLEEIIETDKKIKEEVYSLC